MRENEQLIERTNERMSESKGNECEKLGQKVALGLL